MWSQTIANHRSQVIADDRKSGPFHIISKIAEPTVVTYFGQRKCEINMRSYSRRRVKTTWRTLKRDSCFERTYFFCLCWSVSVASSKAVENISTGFVVSSYKDKNLELSTLWSEKEELSCESWSPGDFDLMLVTDGLCEMCESSHSRLRNSLIRKVSFSLAWDSNDTLFLY